jgi:hypothetical protein
VRTLVAIKNRHIAKPNTGLHVSERDLLARHRSAGYANSTFGASAPFFGPLAARGDQFAITVALHIGVAQDIVAQAGRERGKPAPSVDRFALVLREDRFVRNHVFSIVAAVVGASL